jgi:hypothetical protein
MGRNPVKRHVRAWGICPETKVRISFDVAVMAWDGNCYPNHVDAGLNARHWSVGRGEGAGQRLGVAGMMEGDGPL